MFHAINAWLARQARRARDYRLARDNQIAAANGWQVERVACATYRYRDPRFHERRAALLASGRQPEAVSARWPQ